MSKSIYKKLEEAKKLASTYPDKAIEISTKICELAKTEDLELEKGYALLNIALANRNKSETSSILENAYDALFIFKKENDILGQAKAMNLIGIAYFYSSMYNEALKYFLEVKELTNVHMNEQLLTSVLNNIGEIYKESSIYDKAIKYYKRAGKIACKNNNLFNHAVILGNIGEIYHIEGKLDLALKEYNKSYDILLETDQIVSLADTENRMGKLYFEMEDYPNAKACYFKAYERLRSVENKYYLVDVLINMAELYEFNSKEKTLYLYHDAMNYAKSVGAKKKLFNIYILISQYYEREEDYKNSLYYYKKHSKLNNEIMNLNFKSKLEILNIDLINIKDTDKFDIIRSRLEREIERQKSEIESIKLTNKILGEKVYIDELTGVSNRRSINMYLENLLKNYRESKGKVVLYMIDIDNFKRYNDYWGHGQGDVCLKTIAKCINNIGFGNDYLFGRYGGEEFLYITSIKNYEEAINLGNTIRKKVEELGIFYIYENEKTSTTISLGGVVGEITIFNSSREMIELADKELYRAKDLGRNITILNDYRYKKLIN